MNIVKLIILLTIISLLTNCGIYRKTDTRKVPVNVEDRVEKNIQEGRGFRLMDVGKNNNTGVFDFATSNALWRASIDLFDFVPLSNVDYSGGIIITDWFSDDNSQNESLKITVKFLSNEIRSDGLDVIIFKKTCDNNFNCATVKLDSNLSNEIKAEILKKATMIKEQIPNPNENYRNPSKIGD